MSNNTKLNDFYRGDTVPLTITLSTVDSSGTKTPVDITGSTITLTLKINAEISATVLQKDADITDASNGVALIKLDPSDTDLDIGMYYYDIQWIDADGNVRTLISDIVAVKQDITQ